MRIGGDAAGRGLGQRDDARLGERAARARGAIAATVATAILPAPARSAAVAASAAAPGISALPAITSIAPRSSLSAAPSGWGSGQARSSCASISTVGADLGHHDFGATGRSGAAVTGAPASRSGETKFSSCRTSLPRRPAFGSNSYDVMPQLGTSPRRSIARISLLVEPLEQVAQAVDDHLVGDDEDAVAAVLARQHVEEAAQAQDHVAPALAAGRAEVELADVQALLGELGVLGADAERRQPVEDAELLLAQPLVADAGDRRVVARRRRRGCSAARTRSAVWRART